MKILWRALVFILTAVVVSGCGMHLRQATDLPPMLRMLHFKPVNPNDPVAQLLKKQLQALNVTFANNSKKAITLVLSHSRASNTQPKVGLTTYAMNYTFSLSADAKLLDAKKRLINSHRFTVSNQVMLNLNQVYIINQTHLTQRELRRALVNQIIYWLQAQSERQD